MRKKSIIAGTLILLATILLSGCAHRTVFRTVIEYRDSLVLRTDTVRIPITKEVKVNVVPELDTSFLQTNLAESTAYLDTSTLTLRHSLENKDTTLQAVVIVKDRIITKTDSVVTEKPVTLTRTVRTPPKSYWWLLGYSVITIIAAACYVVWKINK